MQAFGLGQAVTVKVASHRRPSLQKVCSVKHKFLLPTSRKVLSTFQTFCPVGVQVAQTVLHFAQFLYQEKGYFAVGLGVFGVCT